MTGEWTASRRAFHAALAAAVALTACGGVAASSAAAGPAERLREGLFRRHGGEPGPPIARYVSAEGRAFILDRTQPVPMLKFEDSPEVWALAPSPAPRGDVIYKNDLGEPVLRITRLGGFTLFTDERPAGEPASLVGDNAAPLRLTPMSPQAVFERLTQASLRASRAARRPMLFEAEATPESSALIADAAVVASVAIIRLSQRRDGRALLSRFNRVRFLEGRQPSATLSNGELVIVVSPRHGLAGRPSSDRIIKVARGA